MPHRHRPSRRTSAAVAAVAAALVVGLLPAIAGPATAATAEDTGIAGHAVDTAGNPLRNVIWNVYEYRPEQGDWFGMQMGPLLTDATGSMWRQAEPGHQYKLCFRDDYYYDSPDFPDEAWTPAERHVDGCWTSSGTTGATLDQATPVSFDALGQRKDLTVVLPSAGLSLTPVDPFVTGSATVGGTLTVQTGTWQPTDAALTYQWMVSGDSGLTDIPGATAATFVPTADLGGRALTVAVTATRSGYKTMSRWGYAGTVGATVPTTSSPLTISGTPVPGSVLTPTYGTLSQPDAWAGFQWLVDGVPVGGQAGQEGTFTPTAAHVGKKISVRMTVVGDGELHLTAQVTVVTGTLTAATPTISGTKVVGSTLTAAPGTWGPAPVTLRYQWYRSGTAISGATASTYTLTTTDMGATLTVKVTGSKSGFTTASKTSAATSAILGKLTTATPTISGTRTVGSTLTAKPGTWGPSPVTFTYQWYRSGTAISGATASTYKLVSADRGKTMTVKVTGKKTGYATASVTSAKTAVIS
ncbi:hypothetical protein [Cellulomonas sp.]|uniref:hypothetical protein n=1 Tax=Cellulomonas sp. TaxID=40001 RepID=UPI001AFFE100|nr:hypothetical protein [Cellulomonas sp.]MBO9555991.1 hypothetical protein [Cellulomonas sp.]